MLDLLKEEGECYFFLTVVGWRVGSSSFCVLKGDILSEECEEESLIIISIAVL